MCKMCHTALGLTLIPKVKTVTTALKASAPTRSQHARNTPSPAAAISIAVFTLVKLCW